MRSSKTFTSGNTSILNSSTRTGTKNGLTSKWDLPFQPLSMDKNVLKVQIDRKFNGGGCERNSLKKFLL